MRELITDEMVETAARASYTDWAGVLWGRADDYTKRVERSSVRAALEAVAPLIAATARAETTTDLQMLAEGAVPDARQGGRMSARLFQVVREADITGVSGTGVVADGVEFPDGTAVVRWRELEPGNPNYERGVRATTVVFPNVRAVEALHGHNGATRLASIDAKGGE